MLPAPEVEPVVSGEDEVVEMSLVTFGETIWEVPLVLMAVYSIRAASVAGRQAKL